MCVSHWQKQAPWSIFKLYPSSTSLFFLLAFSLEPAWLHTLEKRIAQPGSRTGLKDGDEGERENKFSFFLLRHNWLDLPPAGPSSSFLCFFLDFVAWVTSTSLSDTFHDIMSLSLSISVREDDEFRASLALFLKQNQSDTWNFYLSQIWLWLSTWAHEGCLINDVGNNMSDRMGKQECLGLRLSAQLRLAHLGMTCVETNMTNQSCIVLLIEPFQNGGKSSMKGKSTCFYTAKTSIQFPVVWWTNDVLVPHDPATSFTTPTLSAYHGEWRQEIVLTFMFLKATGEALEGKDNVTKNHHSNTANLVCDKQTMSICQAGKTWQHFTISKTFFARFLANFNEKLSKVLTAKFRFDAMPVTANKSHFSECLPWGI